MTIDLALIFPLEPFSVANMIISQIITLSRVIWQIFIKDKDFLRFFLGGGGGICMLEQRRIAELFWYLDINSAKLSAMLQASHGHNDSIN